MYLKLVYYNFCSINIPVWCQRPKPHLKYQYHNDAQVTIHMIHVVSLYITGRRARGMGVDLCYGLDYQGNLLDIV